MTDYAGGPVSALGASCAQAHVAAGARFVYSDVGYVVLGELVEGGRGRPLDRVAAEEIFAPLGMTDATFLPDEPHKTRAAPTEQRNGRWMRGEVHDPRAFALGGVAGHAGLFGTGEDRGAILPHGPRRRRDRREARFAGGRRASHDDAGLAAARRRSHARVRLRHRLRRRSPRRALRPRHDVRPHRVHRDDVLARSGERRVRCPAHQQRPPRRQGQRPPPPLHRQHLAAEGLLGPYPRQSVRNGIDVPSAKALRRSRAGASALVTNHTGLDRDGNRRWTSSRRRRT